MELDKIDILHYEKGTLCSKDMDGILHIKELPYLSVVQSLEGHYGVQIENDTPCLTNENGAFIAPANKKQRLIHHVSEYSGQMKARWIFLDVLINDAYKLDDIFYFPTIFPDNWLNEANDCLNKIFDSLDICDTMIEYYKFIGILIKIAKPKTPVNKNTQKILTYIHKNYMNTVSIKDMADFLHMSESNFYLFFRKNTNMSPIEYLNRYRLTIAAKLLKTENSSIAEIAKKAGIENQFYFSKIFKDKYGMPPTQYRSTVY